MTEVSPNLEKQLALLRREYVNSLPGRMLQMEQTYSQLLRMDSSDVETYKGTLKEFYRQSHSFVGTGATFGFEGLSKTAKSLENQAQLAVENSTKMSDTLATTLRALLDSLKVQVSVVVKEK